VIESTPGNTACSQGTGRQVLLEEMSIEKCTQQCPSPSISIITAPTSIKARPRISHLKILALRGQSGPKNICNCVREEVVHTYHNRTRKRKDVIDVSIGRIWITISEIHAALNRQGNICEKKAQSIHSGAGGGTCDEREESHFSGRSRRHPSPRGAHPLYTHDCCVVIRLTRLFPTL
jgi:hypothetical protein